VVITVVIIVFIIVIIVSNDIIIDIISLFVFVLVFVLVFVNIIVAATRVLIMVDLMSGETAGHEGSLTEGGRGGRSGGGLPAVLDHGEGGEYVAQLPLRNGLGGGEQGGGVGGTENATARVLLLLLVGMGVRVGFGAGAGVGVEMRMRRMMEIGMWTTGL